jgi:DNA-binding response OmpR family regulator
MAKILVIEDNPVNLFLYKEILEKAGHYEVVMNSDGRNIIDMILKENPTIIILDIQLPGKTGFDVYKEILPVIKKTEKSVLFVSANYSSGEMAEISGVPRDRCITKPIQFKQFLGKIEEVLHNAFSSHNKNVSLNMS